MTEETTRKPRGTVRKFTNSEILKNYAGAIAILLGALPAVGSLVVSLVTAARGEPVAEKTWSTVRSQLNQQAEAVNRLHLRVVQLQAHEEGRTAAALQLKLDDLQKKYDQLKATPSSPPHPAPGPTSRPTAADCRPGYIRIKDRCHSVPRAVAEKVREEARKTEDIQRRLLEEKMRRLKEEKLRQSAEKKVKSVQTAEPMLRPLPKKLDDAVKGE